jgi:hypothetical protein
LVGLAGQNDWHIATGEALARISGKYLPSQLRTQKEGPELATAARGGACGLLLKGSAKKLACGAAGRCCFAPPKKKSNRPSAETGQGASAIGLAIAMAAINAARRRPRGKGKL